MSRITLSIPDELKRKLDESPEVNWAEIVRRGLKRRIVKLKEFERTAGW